MNANTFEKEKNLKKVGALGKDVLKEDKNVCNTFEKLNGSFEYSYFQEEQE